MGKNTCAGTQRMPYRARGGDIGCNLYKAVANYAAACQKRKARRAGKGSFLLGCGAGGAAVQRLDSSLGLLTRRFTQLLEEAPGGMLDLNAAAKGLQVGRQHGWDSTDGYSLGLPHLLLHRPSDYIRSSLLLQHWHVLRPSSLCNLSPTLC